MIGREYIVQAFSCLGKIITAYLNGNKDENNQTIEKAIEYSCIDNYWFTKENILRALDSIASKMLDGKKLNKWISKYSFNRSGIQKTGLIMAGNIPLVGFHDLLSVLLAGNTAVIKPSSKDRRLIKTLCEILSGKFPDLAERIVFTDSMPQNIHAVITTGNNNSTRYFRAEYKNMPMLSRKNRYSIAVLDGSETENELETLGDDIFSYFGLGCRNVSNLFVPQNYDWSMFFDAMKKYSGVMNHPGYNDCFRYQKALSDLSGENYLTDGFVIIRNNSPTFASIAAINYAIYENAGQVKTFLAEQNDKIQCIVSKNALVKNTILFGQTQKPELDDYADGIDTIKFLVSMQK
jgi:hypothetical protein